MNKDAFQVLEHCANFVQQWDRMPLRHAADTFYGIHTGTEFEANLKLSVLRKAIKALAKDAKCSYWYRTVAGGSQVFRLTGNKRKVICMCRSEDEARLIVNALNL